MRMLKKYGLWIAVVLVAYFTKDKWMPMLGMGNKDTQGGDAKVVAAGEDYDGGLA